MHASVLLAASVLVTVASAQTQATGAPATSTVAEAMPPVATEGFQSSEIESNLKTTWCRSQLNLCPKICGGTASTNTCDTTALTYDCVCSNGTAPDVTAYMETLPYFICEANYAQCVAAHPDDLDGQTTCEKNRQCGELNATELTAASSSSSSSSSSATSTSSASGSASQTASSSSSATAASKSDSAAGSINIELATGAFAGLLFGAMGLFL